jgi:pimeloyl-ACP methyl ester carboxylesterase
LRRSIALAGGTAGAALIVRARARRAELQHPPRGRFLSVGGVRLHYLERGFGPSLVLLHGLGSMLEDFALCGVLDEAARDFRVIAFDRPGYGYSERPRRVAWTPLAQARLLRDALHQLGAARPLIVGHSWGCLVALAYALEYPHETRGVVLASGLYYPTLRPDAPLLMPPAVPLAGALLRHSLSPVLGRLLWPLWLRLLFSPMPVPGNFLPAWLALRPGPLRAIGEEAAMTLPWTQKWRRRYAQVSVPTAIVAGTADRYVFTARHSQRLHREIPHSMFLPVPGAGHMVHYAAPDALVRAARMLQDGPA